MKTNDSPLLLHIPHASTVIPSDELPAFLLPELDDELLKMTDRYCDELFTGHAHVIFPVSRLVCDPERFRSDDMEPMSKVGMGAVYTTASSGAPLRSITPETREGILRRYYDPHHGRFTEAVEEKLRAHGRCLIIDGHSFPPEPLPFELDRTPNRPDFCIGTDSFHTPGQAVTAAVEFLKSKGFSVKRNSPFSGSIVPMKYYGRDARVSSLMIEINRRLYMDAHGRKNRYFQEIRNAVTALLGLLCRMECELCAARQP